MARVSRSCLSYVLYFCITVILVILVGITSGLSKEVQVIAVVTFLYSLIALRIAWEPIRRLFKESEKARGPGRYLSDFLPEIMLLADARGSTFRKRGRGVATGLAAGLVWPLFIVWGILHALVSVPLRILKVPKKSYCVFLGGDLELSCSIWVAFSAWYIRTQYTAGGTWACIFLFFLIHLALRHLNYNLCRDPVQAWFSRGLRFSMLRFVAVAVFDGCAIVIMYSTVMLSADNRLTSPGELIERISIVETSGSYATIVFSLLLITAILYLITLVRTTFRLSRRGQDEEDLYFIACDLLGAQDFEEAAHVLKQIPGTSVTKETLESVVALGLSDIQQAYKGVQRTIQRVCKEESPSDNWVFFHLLNLILNYRVPGKSILSSIQMACTLGVHDVVVCQLMNVLMDEQPEQIHELLHWKGWETSSISYDFSRVLLLLAAREFDKAKTCLDQIHPDVGLDLIFAASLQRLIMQSRERKSAKQQRQISEEWHEQYLPLIEENVPELKTTWEVIFIYNLLRHHAEVMESLKSSASSDLFRLAKTLEPKIEQAAHWRH